MRRDLPRQYKYTERNVRLSLYSQHSGDINWLCIPGGPGADSRYYETMLENIALPGKTWLVDFPGNGDHLEGIDENYNFDNWLEIFIPTIKAFENPAIIGQSFGAMLPLFYPELEEILKAFIIVSSAPSNWLLPAARKQQQYKLPELHRPLRIFLDNPSPATFKLALEACYPYYFTGDYKSKGDKVFSNLPFNYHAAAWGQHKAVGYDAKWIPRKVPCIIIGGSRDFITPLEVYQQDERFSHIKIFEIMDAGHMPWLDKPEEFKQIIERFIRGIIN